MGAAVCDDSYLGLPSYSEELFYCQRFKEKKYLCLDFIERKRREGECCKRRPRGGQEKEEHNSLKRRREYVQTKLNVAKMCALKKVTQGGC